LYVCTFYLSFRCLGICILSSANVRQLYRVSLLTPSSPKRGILRFCGQ
jgi:hypothetical protein